MKRENQDFIRIAAAGGDLRRLICLILLCLPLCVSGCGVGGLIAGAIVALVISLDDGSSSGGGASAVNQAFLLKNPSRADLKNPDLTPAGPDAGIVPVCYELRGASSDRVVVEYALEEEGFLAWRLARPYGDGLASEACGGARRSFRWHAAADLDLAGRSTLVKVRVFTQDVPANADVSEPFLVGNTPPGFNLILPPEGRGDISISFVAWDAERDALEAIQLEYWTAAEGRWQALELNEVLEPHLQLSERGALHNRLWKTRADPGIRDHNFADLQVRLLAVDPFGEAVEARGSIDLLNNTPPEVRLAGSFEDLDGSFEIPLPLEIADAESQEVDAVIQHDFFGRGFVELGNDFDDAGFRRRVLEDPGEAGLRAQLGILSLSDRIPGAASTTRMASSPEGRFHLRLWDSVQDGNPLSRLSTRLRITPFDEQRGLPLFVPRFTVDNDNYPQVVAIGEGQGAIAGVGLEDLDGDRRADLALSVMPAGRVDIYLRQDSGNLGAQASYSLDPGNGSFSSPADLILAQLNLDEDDWIDLAVLDTQCPCTAPDSCGGTCNQRGKVAIFFARPFAPGKRRFPPVPDLVLSGGQDLRSLAVGNFSGRGGPDLAIANHDPRQVGFFFRSGPRSYASMKTLSLPVEPGLMLAGDFAPGNGRDELAICELDSNTVAILREFADAPAVPVWSRFAVDRPRSLAAGDFDGDGRLDLAVGRGDENSGSVLIFYNRDSGGGQSPFDRPEREIQLGSGASRLARLRLNGDPPIAEALAALENNRRSLSLIRGVTAENPCAHEAVCAFKEVSFLPLPTLNSTLSPPAAIGDFDGDRRQEVFFGTNQGARLLMARGAGSLDPDRTQTIRLEPDESAHQARLADLDGDGLLDIAVAAAHRSEKAYLVNIYFQSRHGSFFQAPSWRLVAAPQPGAGFQDGPLYLETADLDGDARPDLVALSRQGGIDLFSIDNGAFHPGAGACKAIGDDPEAESCPAAAIEHGQSAAQMQLGAFAGAGEVGLLRLQLTFRTSELRLARLRRTAGGSGALSAENRPEVLQIPLSLAMAAGDLDGDALPDLALLRPEGLLELRLQIPGAPWPDNFRQARQTINIGAIAAGKVSLSRLNADAGLDLLVLSEDLAGRATLSGFLQPDRSVPGAGALFTSLFRLEIPPGLGTVQDAGAVELSGDDLPDLVVATSLEEGDRESLGVRFQQAGGGFDPYPVESIELAAGRSGGIEIESGDLSGDTRPDIVILQKGIHELRIVRTR